MFDIGFSEMIVIAIVALIVIGPERLPKVSRTLGHLIGRMQRYVNDVKADINREMEFEEVRKFKEQFQDAAQSVEKTIHGEIAQVEDAVKQIEVAADVAPAKDPSGAALAQPDVPAASPPESGAEHKTPL